MYYIRVIITQPSMIGNYITVILLVGRTNNFESNIIFKYLEVWNGC